MFLVKILRYVCIHFLIDACDLVGCVVEVCSILFRVMKALLVRPDICVNM
jgi:hypothetical protein